MPRAIHHFRTSTLPQPTSISEEEKEEEERSGSTHPPTSSSSFPLVKATTFTIVNKCDYVVWPGILSNAGVQALPETGFTLQSGETTTISAPKSWGGRFWGRTHCSQDSTGKFSCLTGDCGSGTVECLGNGAAPPATLANSLWTVPGGTGQNFTNTGCVVDLNDSCPSDLKVMSTGGSDGLACKSACEAFDDPQYCCSGAYGTPDTCKPSSYSEVFKTACPRAYSYAYVNGPL
ncbi:hypothetical protein GQ457_02G022490 [Hibiscus cannabinus]